ncbi:sulfotransferase family 2 domain-containing protein [Asticcacaulis sp. BYS171W]|uniref:Sulfotransferase family 2 domain-containing protein n=1 Tax=Asticcacaulis aquaticus TaxID=2984212 RepID=A0ABT5HYN9_9CAUL|nr:sulfotransferase family 2 domain-containing protein [Asticcacaulis aquaticus]MDC7685196.1 sulfotransferase family 2 domain-containing protein [Asticcacaulis aquaticus]
MAPNPKLFFFHNPKAGGVSIRSLMRSISDLLRAPVFENNMVDHRRNAADYSAFKGYDVYEGHYGREIYDQVADNHLTLTNFRDPITRIVSLYNFFRFSVQLSDEELASEVYFAVNFAKTQSFEAFVRSEDEKINVYIQDHHARQLSHSGWGLSQPADLLKACETLRTMTWFHILEESELSLRWGEQVFGLPVPELPHENRSISTTEPLIRESDMSPSTRHIILDKNKNDLRLFEHAVSELHKRVRL